MATIILRDSGSIVAPGAVVKNLPLTNKETDNNFSNLSISMGLTSDLTTTATSNLVVAINEVNTRVANHTSNINSNVTSLTSRVANTEANVSSLSATVANLSSSATTVDIANINSNVGVITNLLTTSKSNVVSAINELYDRAGLDGTISGVVISNSTWSGNTIAVAQGGTGAADSANARVNLGLGTVATQNANNISITGGTITTSGNITASTFFGDGSKLSGISASGGSGLFNTAINGATGAEVPLVQANVYIAPSTVNTRYIVHSIQVTNMSVFASNVTGEFNGTNYSATSFATTIPLPVGTTIEMLKKPKVLQPTDYIQMASDVANALHATIVIESSTSPLLFGQGVDVTTASSYTDLYTATANAVVESVLLVNDDGVNDVKARVVWTDGSNNIQGYYCYDLIVPADGTVEILEKPKYVPSGYKVRVYANMANRLEAMISGKTVS